MKIRLGSTLVKPVPLIRDLFNQQFPGSKLFFNICFDASTFEGAIIFDLMEISLINKVI